MPCAKENCGNITSLPYFRGWWFLFPLECFCSVQITFYVLGAQPLRRTVAMAAKPWTMGIELQQELQEDPGMAGGTRSWQGRNRGNSHPNRWWHGHSGMSYRRDQDWAGSTAHSATTVAAMPPKSVQVRWCICSSGFCPWLVHTTLPLSKPSPIVHLSCFCSTQRYMKYSWKNCTGFPQCSSSLNLFA